MFKWVFVAPTMLLFALPPQVSAKTIVVDCTGNGDFTTLQEGIEDANDGDIIEVAPCTYEEQVTIPDKRLTIVGNGAETTVMTLPGTGTVIRVEGQVGITVKNLSIIRDSPSIDAIVLGDACLTMVGCVVVGRIRGGCEAGGAHITNCQIGDFDIRGWYSTLTNSRFGKTNLTGVPLSTHHSIHSKGCSFESISFMPGFATLDSREDSIGTAVVRGGLDSYGTLWATGSIIDSCYAPKSPEMTLSQCELGTVLYDAIYPLLTVSGCLVLRDFIIAPESFSRGGGQTTFEHNTVLGSFVLECATTGHQASVRSNIFTQRVSVNCVSEIVVKHNIFVQGGDFTMPMEEFSANLWEVDPQFCGPTLMDFTLHETSPAIGNAHDPRDSIIGAFGVGCGSVSVRSTTWGRLKSLYGDGAPSN